MVERVARELAQLITARLKEVPEFLFALPGGSTPGLLFDLLASGPKNDIPWRRVRFFLGDERAVSPLHPLSNYRFIQERLLGPLGIQETQVTRWVTEADNLEVAAREYEAQLLAWKRPLDLVMLGLGSDGHTASLFPHSPQLSERSSLCVSTPVASLEPFVPRVTMTYRAINMADARWFMVTGANKAEKLRLTLEGSGTVEDIPARGVVMASKGDIWFVDEAAAQELSEA